MSTNNVNNFRELFQFEANLLFNTYKLNETPNKLLRCEQKKCVYSIQKMESEGNSRS